MSRRRAAAPADPGHDSDRTPGVPVLYSVSLDVDTALAAPRTCLACGAPLLRAVPARGEVLFVCRGCLRSWGYELGQLVPLPGASVLRPRERGAS